MMIAQVQIVAEKVEEVEQFIRIQNAVAAVEQAFSARARGASSRVSRPAAVRRTGSSSNACQLQREKVCSTVAHSSARATCVFHFFDQPRQVSLGPLLQFIYWVVAVVDADLF